MTKVKSGWHWNVDYSLYELILLALWFLLFLQTFAIIAGYVLDYYLKG